MLHSFSRVAVPRPPGNGSAPPLGGAPPTLGTTDLIDEYIKACIRNALWHTMAALALLDDVANRRIRRGRNFKDQQDPLA